MIILACLIFGVAITTALIIDIFTGSHHTGMRLGLFLVGKFKTGLLHGFENKIMFYLAMKKFKSMKFFCLSKSQCDSMFVDYRYQFCLLTLAKKTIHVG